MAENYHIGRLATLRNQLKQLVKEDEQGKIEKSKAADEKLELREQIESILKGLNEIEHE